MKIWDEYIIYIQWHLYNFVQLTGEWLEQPAILLGKYEFVLDGKTWTMFSGVSITIAHIFLLYFIISAIGLLWLAYKLKYAKYPTDEELNDAEADWLYELGCDQEESWR